jgi:DNA polymerase III alpha subunit (gram-positive type)
VRASQYPSEVAPWDKIQLPAPGPDSWRAGAKALLAMMSPEGQARALAEWQKISERAGGPFTPALAAPAGAAQPAPGLLDDFTVVDLEFQAKPQALLELAAIRYQNWQPVGKVVSFVRCREELNPHVARLTGITRADVYNAPTEKAVLQAFFKLAEGSVLVAHNYVADKKQLEDARTRCGATTPLPNPWFCTLALARSRRSKGAACGLGELCLDFNINTLGAHRAERDVQMCFQVLRRFHEQQPITELITSTAKPKKMGQAELFATAA